MVNAPSDRAQLILVGSITIAFVILSLGILINTSFYTEQASPAFSNPQVEDVRSFELEYRQGSRKLIHRINHRQRWQSQSTLESEVSEGLDNFSAAIGQQYALSKPASVNGTFNEGQSSYGSRLVQANQGTLDNTPLVDTPSATRIGWFTLNVDVINASKSTNLTIRIDGRSRTLVYEMQKTTGDDGANLTVWTHTTGPGNKVKQVCDPINGRVLVDLYVGSVVADRCWPKNQDLHGIRDIEPSHDSVTVSNGGQFRGSFELVTNVTDPDGGTIGPCSPSSPRTEPCQAPAVWTANVSTHYVGNDVSFNNTRNIAIYGESS